MIRRDFDRGVGDTSGGIRIAHVDEGMGVDRDVILIVTQGYELGSALRGFQA